MPEHLKVDYGDMISQTVFFYLFMNDRINAIYLFLTGNGCDIIPIILEINSMKIIQRCLRSIKTQHF